MNNDKIKADFKNDGCYLPSDNGMTLTREYGLTPNGNDMNGRWVLRDAQGCYVDHDTYRSDLTGRNGIKIVHWLGEQA